jgi:uncharacterized membrane protein HdeD (DUF308 family)
MATAHANPLHLSVTNFVLGVILILCGLFALVAPIISTIATTLILAIAVGAAGFAQVFQAFRSPAWKGFLLSLFLGIVYIAGSAIFLLRPITGAFALTFLLAWLLLISGGGEVLLGLKIRPQKGWIALIFSGVVGIIASIWLFLRIPLAGLFVPGIALGVALLFEGWAFIVVGLSRNAPTEDRQQLAERNEPVRAPL